MSLGRGWWVGSGILIGAISIGVVASTVRPVGTAPGAPKGDHAAIVKCQRIIPIASGYGTITAVLRAETSTAAAVAYWQEHRSPLAGASPFRKLAAQTPMTVCLLSGEFGPPLGPPNLLRGARPPETVLRVLVWGNDEVVLDSAGYRAGLAPETPADLGAAGQ